VYPPCKIYTIKMAARKKTCKVAAEPENCNTTTDITSLFGNESKFNVLSNEMLRDIIFSQNEKYHQVISVLQEQSIGLIDRMSDGFAKLSCAINDSASQSHKDTMLLIEKMENLQLNLSTRERQVDLPSQSIHKNLFFDKELSERKDKMFQMYRSKQLVSLYKDLITDQASPFIPPKFRPHVNKSTPEYEREIKRAHAIQNVIRECEILDGRCNEWEKIVSKIDDKVRDTINNLCDNQEEKDRTHSTYVQNCSKDCEDAKRNWNVKQDRIKQTYDEEKRKGLQCCLKIVDEHTVEQHDRNSKNFHRWNSSNHRKQPQRSYYRRY